MQQQQQQQQQQRTAAALAVRPLARSMLVPRSTPLSPGAIAGAVVGSVAGALLLAFCLFPFIVRARRRRLDRHGDPGLAEMGQGPGGPIFPPHDPDGTSYKGSSGSGPDSGTAHDTPQTTAPPQQPHSTLPDGVTASHGLPSPVSSPASPAAASSPVTGLADPPPTAPVPLPPPAAPEQSRRGSRSAADRESSRELSASDSYGAPSRQLTGITTAGITEEPESFDRTSGSPETGYFPSLKGSLRSLIYRRRSSQQRRDSRRSTAADTDGPRSPSVITNEFLPPPGHPPSGLEFDTDTPGLAWDYYNDPTLGVDLSEYSSGPASLPASALGPTSAPLGTPFPPGQSAAPLFGVAPSATSGPITEEPDTASPGSDATVLPGDFSRQSTLFQARPFSGSLQRTDTLPLPEIVADIPSPPLQYSIGPSGNPMQLMAPSNPTENAWYLEQNMRMIENSPPLPAPEPVPSIAVPVDHGPAAAPAPAPAPAPVPNSDVKLSFQPQYPPDQQTPYQSPPPSALEPGSEIYEQTMQYYTNHVFKTASDYSTPPPSNGPSLENTPDTRYTPLTASPSPPAETEATLNSHLTISPGLSANLSPSPGLSPAPSPGRTPDPTPGVSPGRSPARPPGGFVCEVCGAVKNSFHQFNHHKRYHERPWQCKFEGCERSFGTVTHLRRHINDKHVKTRKFYCTQPGCDYSRQGTKSFPRKDNWKRHMLKKHSIDPQNATDEDYLGDDMEVI